jgi:putative oxidoreductase
MMANPEEAKASGRGYPAWFMYLTGAVEVIGAVALAVPRTATLGALILGCTMIAAVATHLVNAEGAAAVPALVLLAMLTPVGYARRETFHSNVALLRGARGASG